MSSVGRLAAAGTNRRLLSSALAAPAGAAAVALAVTLSARAEGAYYPRAWGPLGIALVICLGLLVALGLRVSRTALAAAAALVALGLLGVASVTWGGLPQVAWEELDRSLIAAAALLVGASLAGRRRSRAVFAGVLLGVTAQTAEILVRTGDGSAPASWFVGRLLEGPVGYHNAQALLCAATLPLALVLACEGAAPLRAAAAAAAAPLLAVLLLTQSRGGLAVAIVTVAVALGLARRGRMTVVAAVLAASGAGLGLALRDVDRALVTSGPAGSTPQLRAYALMTLAVAAAAATAATLPAPSFLPRIGTRTAVLLGAGTLAIAAGIGTPLLLPHIRTAAAAIATDAPPNAAPGATRYASISLDGRRDAWRVALDAIRAEPLTGDGAGSFARLWGFERRIPELYILQPHSIELELAAELGLPAVGLFAVFLAAIAVALRRSLRADRLLAAGAAAALVAVVAEASVDWTWSFPGLLAPVLLVVGAATPRPGPGRTAPWWLVLPAVAGALFVITLPYAAAQEVAAASGPGEASRLNAALRLDPWDPTALSAQGRLLEAEGSFQAAAAHYAEAARYSQRPWLERFREARALRRAHDYPGAVQACLRTHEADPHEISLFNFPCDWPWVPLNYPGTHPPGPEGLTRPSAAGT